MHISLTKDTVTGELARLLAAAKRPKSIYAAGAKAVQVEILRHLTDLQSRGNQRGWPSRKFFRGGPDSVSKHVGIASLTDTGATITIADPRFIHRIEGGTVTAKRVKSLAIPLTAEAYAMGGKGTLRELAPDLVLIKTARGAYLARPTRGKGKNKGKSQLKFLFKLVKSVTHKPHPSEMPDKTALTDSARAAMLTAARLLITQ